MELGDELANIVFDDADLDEAVQAAMSVFVLSTGQFCIGRHPAVGAARGLRAGARGRVDRESLYMQPTVVADVPNDSRLVQEVFGPVLTVQVSDTEEEAVALANSTSHASPRACTPAMSPGCTGSRRSWRLA